MKTLKDVMLEAILTKESIIEGLKQDVDKLFKGDKQYAKLLKAAKTNPAKELDLIVYLTKKDELDDILKKNKIRPEDFIKELV